MTKDAEMVNRRARWGDWVSQFIWDRRKNRQVVWRPMIIYGNCRQSLTSPGTAVVRLPVP